ncbi:MAG: hypothetical protein IPI85_09885 [Dehalococcoidia bacterium]|nr:hypothetical protein [Dehalococcoidia bacterium]
MTSQSPMRTTREPSGRLDSAKFSNLLVGEGPTARLATSWASAWTAPAHVSEIITRLGVESRDEAAEYWRHHNGLRLRFSRLSGGFFGWSALKWGAGAALVGAIGIAAAVVLLVLREGSGGDPDQGPAPWPRKHPPRTPHLRPR